MVQEKTGGYALKESGVTSILAEDIQPTLKVFARTFGIPLSDLHLIGSAGKKGVSGDIDIAIDANKYIPETILHDILYTMKDCNVVWNRGTRVCSVAFPIMHTYGTGPYRVQIDLMFVNNVEYAKFAYFAPDERLSEYKGAVRTILLQSVASAMNMEGIDKFIYDDEGNLLIRAGRTLDLSTGLRRIYQHRPKRKDGNGYVKTLKTITSSEFHELYPQIQLQDIDDDVIDSPSNIVRILFGYNVAADDVETAENVLELIDERFNDDQRNTIQDIAFNRLKAVEHKMVIPIRFMAVN